jgi:putative inorganic carbon (HCO3(-)) transporter
MRLERTDALPGAHRRPIDWRAASLWGATALIAALLGYDLGAAPLIALALLALAVTGGCLLFSFRQPRWALVVGLFLGWGYVPDVASLHHGNGLPFTGALLVCLSLPLLVRQAVGLERLRIPSTELALVLAMAIALIVTLENSTSPSAGFSRLVLFIKDVPFMLLMLLLLDSMQWLRRAAWAAVLAFGGLGALASFQQLTHTYTRVYFGFSTVQGDQGGLVRSAGPLSTDWFGWELVPVTVLALYLALGARKRNIRILAWSLFAASLLGLYFSFARASLIAIGVALVLAALLRGVRLATLGIGIAVGVAALVLFLPATAKNRLVQTIEPFTGGSIATSSDASVRYRAGENLAAVHMFLNHPYLGVGPGNYPVLYTKYSESIALDPRAEGRHPHNLYLEYFAEMGLLGGLLILTFIALALRGAWRARRVFTGRDRLLAEGVFVALVGYFINGVFLHPSGYTRYLWLVLGFGFVCRRLAESKEAAP